VVILFFNYFSSTVAPASSSLDFNGIGFILGHAFFNRFRSAINQFFRFFERKTSDFADNFDDSDFVRDRTAARITLNARRSFICCSFLSSTGRDGHDCSSC
jgi:hypothetical protein